MTDEITKSPEVEDFFAVYADYARTLRAWLVAYGVGGPILFMTQEAVAERVRQSGQAATVVQLFLFGVVAQVAIALLNKWASWVNYFNCLKPKGKATWLCKGADWISEQFWLDIAADLASVCLFSCATLKVLLIFAR